VRAQRLAGRDKISLSEADRTLDEKEKLERMNWQKIYGFDYFEQEADADLVIDTSTMTPKEIVEKIVEEIKKREL
jgi:cytidylate kinase